MKVFETVYICRSGIRAAEMLGVTASAISQSLHKLRIFFDDPLFIREGKGVSPTSIADNIHESISETIGLLFENLLISEPTSLNQITIYCTPFSAVRVMPTLASALKEAGIHCGIKHISSDGMLETTEEILTYRKADVVFGTAPYYSFSTVTEVFDSAMAVAVCRKDHPRIGDVLTQENMKKERSTFLLNNTESVKKAQVDLENYFVKREFAFSSSSLITILSMTEASDYISFMPDWFAAKFAGSFNLKILKSDFVLPPVSIYMTYHKNLMKNTELFNVVKKMREQNNKSE
nr:LysR family transcriptional regulator [Rahnella sp. LAC-M12]